MAKKDWVWMPHAAHLIVGQDCRFHLATYVNGFIVSTVGEYLPDESSRETHAEVRGIKLEGQGDYRRADFLKKCGWVEIGCDRTYETMVFKAKKSASGCCAWELSHGLELECAGYKDSKAATEGHLRLCSKYDRRSC